VIAVFLVLLLGQDAAARGDLRKLAPYARRLEVVVRLDASNWLSEPALRELRRWPVTPTLELSPPISPQEAKQLRKLKRFRARLAQGSAKDRSLRRLAPALTSVRAQIQDGPGPFNCKVLGTIAALPAGTISQPPAPDPAPSASAAPVVPQPREPGPPPSEATGMRIVCLAPASVKLINGASVTLEVITAQASGALVLPVEAVAGGQGKGLVDVVRPDGTKETREVTLGLTDGRMIEITSGLTEQDTVALPGPDIPQAPPGQDGGKGDLPGGGVVVKG